MTPRGHAFVSYVHEDASQVDALVAFLEASGIQVWRDSAQLWPGDDWKIEIRRAIERGSLAFVACLSTSAAARETTYQNEELVLAAEQFRLRRPGRPWLFPVRLDECDVPLFDLGAGKTLESLQIADLFGAGRETALARLASSILRILRDRAAGEPDGSDDQRARDETLESGDGSPSASVSAIDASSAAYVKRLLRDPTRDIELDDYVTELADSAATALRDEAEFPTSAAAMQDVVAAGREIARRVERYWEITRPVAEVLAIGCAWGTTIEQDALWARTMRTIAGGIGVDSGMTALIELRRYPTIMGLYAGALGAVARERFSALRAITTDAKLRKDGRAVPVIGVSHVWLPFGTFPFGAQVVARITAGEALSDEEIRAIAANRSRRTIPTPVSDQLRVLLRPTLRSVIRDDTDYDDTFDATELMLALIATDAEIQGSAEGLWLPGPWFGAFMRREQYMQIEHRSPNRLRAELGAESASWKPLLGGLFGGSEARAIAAFDKFLPEYKEAAARATWE
jgi:TIR domain